MRTQSKHVYAYAPHNESLICDTVFMVSRDKVSPTVLDQWQDLLTAGHGIIVIDDVFFNRQGAVSCSVLIMISISVGLLIQYLDCIELSSRFKYQEE